MESPSWSTIKYPSQGLQEGRVLCTAVWPVGTNNRKRPIPNLARRREATSLASPGVNSNTWWLSWGAISKQAHTSSPPLTLDNSRVVEGPAPLKKLCSRAQAMLGGEPDYLSLAGTSQPPTRAQAPFPPSEVTFHLPIARVLVQGLGHVEAPAPRHDCYPNHIAPAPHGSSCGGEPTGRHGPTRRHFRLSLAGYRGQRPGHQALACSEPQPRPGSRVGPRTTVANSTRWPITTKLDPVAAGLRLFHLAVAAAEEVFTASCDTVIIGSKEGFKDPSKFPLLHRLLEGLLAKSFGHCKYIPKSTDDPSPEVHLLPDSSEE
ncbi:hypothetical protein L3Q82_005686 [Scortum barcoo]|uniref:Uncharacterized protein n=1 Tax=Scortum barcoo TaxID=214431 RepID=A0ACB8V6A3_9TELE|nr:hypothetical protein L3Q82_005686 [Scortum barcoo]